MGFFSYLKQKMGKKSKEQQTKYIAGLSKSKKNFTDKLKALSLKYKKVDEDYFEELEQILIEADVGVKLVLEVVEATKQEVKARGLIEPKDINEILVDKMFISYASQGESVVNEIQFQENGPTVLLVVGVNGVGKTTTIAKLAKRYKDQGKSVMLGAADTFRAGAVDQLKVWADRLKCPIISGADNSDPASIAYDSVQAAIKNKIDLLIIDTAGRLQNKSNLMDELAKIRRVIGKEIPSAPHEVFLIIDATTGQNGVLQAKAFAEATGLTGIVITKMDGTSKGGIILAIRDELGIPVRFVGLGEKMDDLEEFDLDQYLYGLCLGGTEE